MLHCTDTSYLMYFVPHGIVSVQNLGWKNAAFVISSNLMRYKKHYNFKRLVMWLLEPNTQFLLNEIMNKCDKISFWLYFCDILKKSDSVKLLLALSSDVK